MTKYPIGIHEFASLREGGFAYVDKTAFIYRLAHEGCYYFLSRPRRFGKSLLLSTIKSYFLGQKELFEGLALEGLEKEWTVHPVLYLDLGNSDYQNEDALRVRLEEHLCEWEKTYGQERQISDPTFRFINVIRRAHEQTGRRVVILIDEYDKPILQAIGNRTLHDSRLSTLGSFYSVLKSMGEDIKFAFVCGTTESCKRNMGSYINNLDVLNTHPRYATLCGLTAQDICDTFAEGVDDLAAWNQMTREQCLAALSCHAGGYGFDKDALAMYNPHDVMSALHEGSFKAGGLGDIPAYLIEALRLCGRPMSEPPFESWTSTLTIFDHLTPDPVSMLYQAGYLTIKGYDRKFDAYTLDFPNDDARDAYYRRILPAAGK